MAARGVRAAVAAAVWALAFSVATLRAQQPGAAEAEQYPQLVANAVREFNEGNWAEARALFEQAHALQPSARTQRGLGLTSFELRHYVDAISELQTAIDDQRNALSPEQRLEVTEVIARAQRYVGTIRVELAPKDAMLLLNGRAVDKCEFVLNVGDYELDAKAPGYKDASLRLNVEGGQTRTVKVELVPVSAEIAVTNASAPKPDAATHLGVQRIVGWTATGVGVVGLTLGVIFELQRSSKLSDRGSICPSGRDCTADDQRSIDSLTGQARTASTIGAVSLVAGAVFVAGGLVLVFTAPSSDRANQVSLAPSIGRDVRGLVLTVRSW